MANILVRKATGPDDMDTLRTLLQAYADHLRASPGGAAGICIENFAAELEGLPGSYDPILLAFVDRESAGCVALKAIVPHKAHPSGDPKEAKACEMKRLWVGRSFRGLGLGRILIAEVIDHAAAAGFNAMYLDTVPAAMPEANHLYKSLGFVEVDRYNANPVADVLFFRKDLNSVSAESQPAGNHARY